MTTKEILELVGILLLMGGALFTVLRFLLSRIQSAQDHTLHIDESARERDDHIRKDITEIKQDYVRKDELMSHIQRIERNQEGLQSSMERGQISLQAGIDRVHTRLDGFTVVSSNRRTPSPDHGQ